MTLGMRTASVVNVKRFPDALAPRTEIRHVIATKFQPGGRSEISARAEIRHKSAPESCLYLHCILYVVLWLSFMGFIFHLCTTNQFYREGRGCIVSSV